MITTQELIAKFQQALSEKWGYIWGTAGVMWTAAKQKELEKTTDSDREQGRRYGKKWIGHMVADCSGLFTWAFKQLGGTMYHGSNTMYLKWCSDKGKLSGGKRTDGKVLKPGTAVFVWNGKNYSHVGLYIGDGTVVEAMGTRNGVTTTKVSASKWTNWGELNGVDYGSGPAGTGETGPIGMGQFAPSPTAQAPTADTSTPSPATQLDPSPTWRPTVRRGDKNDTVREAQTMLDRLGYSLGPCGIDGDFGKATEAAVREFQSDHKLIVDGVVGPMTWDELEKTVAKLTTVVPTPEKKYRVCISGLDLTQATALQRTYPGSTLTEEG